MDIPRRHGYSSDDTVVRVGCLVKQIIKTAALVLFHLLCPLRPALPCLPFQLLQSLLLIGVQSLPIAAENDFQVPNPLSLPCDILTAFPRPPCSNYTIFRALWGHFVNSSRPSGRRRSSTRISCCSICGPTIQWWTTASSSSPMPDIRPAMRGSWWSTP